MFGNKPKALVCYLCGREFGTQSLSIHIKSCIKKWQDLENMKPKNQRRPLPKPPQEIDRIINPGNKDLDWNDINQFNSAANDKFVAETMVQCNYCGRRFNENSYKIHQKSCTADNPCKQVKGKEFSYNPNNFIKQPSQPQQQFPQQRVSQNPQQSQQQTQYSKITKLNNPPVILKPKTLVCYICGREFGTTSLQIHIKQCMKKFEDEEFQKPKIKRRTLPQPPPLLYNVITKGESLSWEEINSYNFQAANKYSTESLIQCPFCFRTFNDKAFQSHQKSCTKDTPSSQVNQQGFHMAGQAIQNSNQHSDYQEVQDIQRQQCLVCQRFFAIDRIQKHQQACVKQSHKPKPKIKYVHTIVHNPKPVASQKWKLEHQEFLQSMQYQKKINIAQQKGIPLNKLPPPPQSSQNNLIPCPFCDRKFSECKFFNKKLQQNILKFVKT